jgi:aminocarboxymuconate-semialdehyde decarboxylase
MHKREPVNHSGHGAECFSEPQLQELRSEVDMIIDWQHHYCPPGILTKRGKKRLEKNAPIYNDQGQVASHFKPELYEIDTHVKFMDAAGIDKAVLSMAGSLTFEECKIINDAFARIIKEYPDRFIGLASFVPGKGDGALSELDRAIRGLGLKGVSIDYQIEGQTLDSKALWPLYERVSELNVPLFIHIAGTRQGFEGLMSKDVNLWTTLGTMVVDQSATVRIILSGILTQFPDLQIVIAHLGGGIAAIQERFTKYLKMWGKGIWTELGGTPPFPEPLDKQFEEYFNKLYFDMAGFEGGMNAVKCALIAIDPKKLLFGTDYPFNFTDIPSEVKEYIQNIRKLDLPREAIEGMLGGNAARLVGIL